MARLDCAALEDLVVDMDKLANLPDECIKQMLLVEADVLMPAQQAEAKRQKVYDTGQTVNSIKVKAPKKYKTGWRAYITFNRTRTNGVRNAEVAYLNEYGVPHKSGKQKSGRQFIEKANESNIDRAVSAAEDVYQDYLNKYNL